MVSGIGPNASLALATTTLPMAIWMTKNFMDAVPVSLEEAAWVDGASGLTALRTIVLPLMRQGLGVVFIFVFIQAWGNFFVPFVLLLVSGLATLLNHSADETFADVTAIIDSLLADQWRAFLVSCVGLSLMMFVAFRDLRLVVIGMQGGSKAELNIGKLLRKRGAVVATSLRARRRWIVPISE